jgi:membrane protease YdiL (CAAX protease family)
MTFVHAQQRLGGSPELVRRATGLALGCALLIALVVAVVVRRVLAGNDPAGNKVAGLVFAVLLAAATVLAGRFQPPTGWVWLGRDAALRPGVLGVLAAAVLCVGPLAWHLSDPGGSLGFTRFPAWALVVTAVAVTEEAFLRGALWQAVSSWRGELVALGVTTVAFALLHVPFYGPEIIPLDLAVGLLLGGLRMVTGGLADSVAAHLLADLAGWWLR